MFKSIKDQTDEVLLVKLKRGNIRSLEAIYDRYAPMVLNFVRKMIKDQMRAEIKAKCTEYELDSNNITKIKTFNGVPHEAVVL